MAESSIKSSFQFKSYKVDKIKFYSKPDLNVLIRMNNIPLDEIRDSMVEIPRDKEVLMMCRAGLRSYIAYRMLIQNGYDVKNISGGYLSHMCM